MSDSTQLVDVRTYDVSQMVFMKAELKTVPIGDGKSGPTYQRINIKSKNFDKSTGDLVFSVENAFCFGVQENLDDKTQEVKGYVLPIALWTRPEKGGPTQEERDWVEGFNRICNHCKDHLLKDETKDEIGKYELEAADLKTFNPLYWKKEKGKIIEGQGPMLYAKLLTSKKDGRVNIVTPMFDMDTGRDLSIEDVTGKYYTVTACIKVENIYIGAKCALQVKVSEFGVKFAPSGPRRLLPRPPAIPAASSSSEAGPSSSHAPAPITLSAPLAAADSDDDDAGSIVDDEPTPAPVAAPPPVAPPASTTARKTVAARKK